MTANVTVAFTQHPCVDDFAVNLNATIKGIRQAAAKEANLVVLQELHSREYFCQTENAACFDWAESIPGPTSNTLGALAKELNIVIVASIFERRASGIYHNTAVVLDVTGEIAGLYRKMHIPDDPGYYEKYYFTPGDLGFNPINTSLGRLGVLVCWDQWFPEAARLMTLAGAEILVYPTAIGWEAADTQEQQQRQYEAWVTVQRAHAITNGLPIVVCNRVGLETDPSGQTHGIQFWGNSFIAGPQGEILTSGPSDKEATQCAQINLHHNEHIRRNWPFLRDRRIDAYRDLLLRYRD